MLKSKTRAESVANLIRRGHERFDLDLLLRKKFVPELLCDWSGFWRGVANKERDVQAG